jgi:hypothetical protein
MLVCRRCVRMCSAARNALAEALHSPAVLLLLLLLLLLLRRQPLLPAAAAQRHAGQLLQQLNADLHLTIVWQNKAWQQHRRRQRLWHTTTGHYVHVHCAWPPAEPRPRVVHAQSGVQLNCVWLQQAATLAPHLSGHVARLTRARLRCNLA